MSTSYSGITNFYFYSNFILKTWYYWNQYTLPNYFQREKQMCTFAYNLQLWHHCASSVFFEEWCLKFKYSPPLFIWCLCYWGSKFLIFDLYLVFGFVDYTIQLCYHWIHIWMHFHDVNFIQGHEHCNIWDISSQYITLETSQG